MSTIASATTATRTTMTMIAMSTPARLPYGRAARDPNHVFAAVVRRSVEPAVAGLDPEGGPLEELVPLGRRDPRERHRRLALGAADGERERPRVLVPFRAFVDARLALKPAAVRLGNVVGAGGEDVEDETSAWEEQLAR